LDGVETLLCKGQLVDVVFGGPMRVLLYLETKDGLGICEFLLQHCTALLLCILAFCSTSIKTAAPVIISKSIDHR